MNGVPTRAVATRARVAGSGVGVLLGAILRLSRSKVSATPLLLPALIVNESNGASDVQPKNIPIGPICATNCVPPPVMLRVIPRAWPSPAGGVIQGPPPPRPAARRGEKKVGLPPPAATTAGPLWCWRCPTQGAKPMGRPRPAVV